MAFERVGRTGRLSGLSLGSLRMSCRRFFAVASSGISSGRQLRVEELHVQCMALTLVA